MAYRFPTTKNPMMSLWLSASNTVLSSVRGQVSAMTSRAIRSAMQQGLSSLTTPSRSTVRKSASRRKAKR